MSSSLLLQFCPPFRTLQATVESTCMKLRRLKALLNSQLVILSFYYIDILKCMKDFIMSQMIAALTVKVYYCKSKLQSNHEKGGKRY